MATSISIAGGGIGLDERGESIPENPGGAIVSSKEDAELADIVDAVAPETERERLRSLSAAKSAIVGVGGPKDGIGSVGAGHDEIEVFVKVEPLSDK